MAPLFVYLQPACCSLVCSWECCSGLSPSLLNMDWLHAQSPCHCFYVMITNLKWALSVAKHYILYFAHTFTLQPFENITLFFLASPQTESTTSSSVHSDNNPSSHFTWKTITITTRELPERLMMHYTPPNT